MASSNFEQPHRRYNPLLEEWVLVSPHRAKRPWQGQLEAMSPPSQPAYDPNCYLCPGNMRANGASNPNYSNCYVFNNDFAALTEHDSGFKNEDSLLMASAEKGECRVICFHPDHSKTLPRLSLDEIIDVVKTWAAQSAELGETYQSVQVFENKGAAMGCSNPHPHGQIWAQEHLPSIVERKHRSQKKYYLENKTALLLDYVQKEIGEEERIVIKNDQWIAVVPFWAAWPFETLVLPRNPVQRLSELDKTSVRSLAEILKQLTTKYDNLFTCSFPYSMGWHGAPFDKRSHPEWLLHASFLPPLLRSSTVKKFMVGYEMFAEPQRDITPEQAAEKLRFAGDIHYSEQSAHA